MTCANHPDREHRAFCQNCGKPLCAECARTVGQAVFCEPCLEARLAATAPGFGAAASGSRWGTPVGSAPPNGAPMGSAPPPPVDPAFSAPGVSPFAAAQANPGIAFLLGFIPGVGAMYNGQYAKGVVHLIVFAIFVSLADQNGIFGLFVAGWVFYQAFEAYHTAKARRDGTPLPNPFGLNEIGERFGFGRSWPAASANPGPFWAPRQEVPPASVPSSGPVAPPAGSYRAPNTGAAYTATAGAGPFTGPGAPQEPAPWGAPVDGFTPVAPLASPPSSSRFPVGALVLIGLGTLFLLGSTRMFESFPVRYLLPFLLIGVGVWVFVRRMTSSGVGLADDGSPDYRLRLIRALQSSVWIILSGILFLLDELRVLSWGRSWPLFIIVGGIMVFLQRSAYTTAARQSMYPGYGAQAPPPVSAPVTPPVSTDPGTSIVPRDREGL